MARSEIGCGRHWILIGPSCTTCEHRARNGEKSKSLLGGRPPPGLRARATPVPKLPIEPCRGPRGRSIRQAQTLFCIFVKLARVHVRPLPNKTAISQLPSLRSLRVSTVTVWPYSATAQRCRRPGVPWQPEAVDRRPGSREAEGRDHAPRAATPPRIPRDDAMAICGRHHGAMPSKPLRRAVDPAACWSSTAIHPDRPSPTPSQWPLGAWLQTFHENF